MKPAFAVAATTLGMLAASATASGAPTAASAWPPASYRYTGWLSPGSGDRPLHAVTQAGVFVLNFWDGGSARPTRYRVCWAHPNGRSRKCVPRTARHPKISRVTISGPHLQFGRYVARWYVHGQVVASWPFVYGPERNSP
jgi:hypothetical protein